MLITRISEEVLFTSFWQNYTYMYRYAAGLFHNHQLVTVNYSRLVVPLAYVVQNEYVFFRVCENTMVYLSAFKINIFCSSFKLKIKSNTD